MTTIIPIRRAYACADCECLTRGDGHGKCGACGGDAVIGVWEMWNATRNKTTDAVSPAQAGVGKVTVREGAGGTGGLGTGRPWSERRGVAGDGE